MYVHPYLYIYFSELTNKSKMTNYIKKVLLANLSNYIGCDVYFLEGLMIDNQYTYEKLLFCQLFKIKNGK